MIIRNEENGKFVIGALFKRERENPGPKFQVSSDAAAALGMLAGSPDMLNVTALVRQEVPIVEEAALAPPVAEPGTASSLPPAEVIETASLDDPIAAAGAALTDVELTAATITPKPSAETALATPAVAKPTIEAPAPSKSTLEKPFVQIGLFSVKDNANNTGIALRNAGVLPRILEETSKGKTYYRVTVGPAPTSADRSALLKKVKGLGYTDAYFVRK